jgi:hypothetical protein
LSGCPEFQERFALKSEGGRSTTLQREEKFT